MTTKIKRPQAERGQGGKREGAGRPKEANPAIKLATIKMTPQQHAKFLDLGGSRWVKRLIDEHKLEKAK